MFPSKPGVSNLPATILPQDYHLINIGCGLSLILNPLLFLPPIYILLPPFYFCDETKVAAFSPHALTIIA